MTILVRLGMLGWPFCSTTGQDRHAPAGRVDTPVTRLGRASSYQVTRARPVACTTHGLPDGSTAPLKTLRVRSGQFRVRPAGRTRSMIRTRPDLHWSGHLA